MFGSEKKSAVIVSSRLDTARTGVLPKGGLFEQARRVFNDRSGVDGDQSPVSNGFPPRETIDGKTGARGVSAGPFLADRGDQFNNGQAADKRLEYVSRPFE